MKVLYLMHVNWHWIRQRPQVIACLLAERHSLRLMHYAMYHSVHYVDEAPPPVGAQVLHRLPGRLKRALPSLAWVDQAWITHQVQAEVRRFAPDVLWLTHPDFEAAAAAVAAPHTVYDCMDDHLAFHPDAAQLALVEAERRLVERAALTIFSSDTLAERVSRRSQPRRQIVVNNGVDAALCQRAPAPPMPHRDHFTLGYFGTISRWFDWPLALQLLDALPTARLRLAGPLETPLPRHPRIAHVGIVAHAQLAGFAAGCDALVMPFKLTPLIEAVDPVKLYEYIAFGRPALAPRYRETERFEPLVTLYRDADQAIAQVSTWIAAARAVNATPAWRNSDGAVAAFLQANTWQLRGAQILTALG